MCGRLEQAVGTDCFFEKAVHVPIGVKGFGPVLENGAADGFDEGFGEVERKSWGFMDRAFDRDDLVLDVKGRAKGRENGA
jgi:hypothetical protein